MTWSDNKTNARMLMALWLLSHGFNKSELNIPIL